jgi:hypothetical protein
VKLATHLHLVSESRNACVSNIWKNIFNLRLNVHRFRKDRQMNINTAIN